MRYFEMKNGWEQVYIEIFLINETLYLLGILWDCDIEKLLIQSSNIKANVTDLNTNTHSHIILYVGFW